jgi:tRNA-binding EMAP/Myf-like protein
MTFDSIEYVTKFPHTYILDNSDDVNTDIIGYFDFRIVDSLFIFATTDTDGLWSFVSLSDKTNMGQFLKRGQGPNEFLFFPSVQVSTNFFKDNGNLYAAIYDSQKGKLYKMNIDKTIKHGELDISIMKDSLPQFLFNLVMIDTTEFLCKAINNGATQQLRYLMRNQTKDSSPNLEKLNRATIKKGADVNIISTMTKYSKENDMVVEMPVMLNYLNFYSIDKNVGKTICIGDKLNNIEIIQNTHFPEIVETFYDLRFYKNFWGVVLVNENKLSLEKAERKKFPAIFLFNWQGEPVAELKLDRHLTAFDIDLKQGFLYGLDAIEETFFKYDIRDILNELKSK